MKLVVGLGNPGPEYDGTRHNLGWEAVRLVARELALPRFRRGRHGLVTRGGDVTLLLPTTYMNASGLAVAAALRSARAEDPSDVIVVHDDLDLALGRLKLRLGGSSGGHRGVASIIDALGWDGFVRVKVGIGRPPAGMDPIDFVLRRPAGDEARLLGESVHRAAEAVLAVLREGVEAAMNTFNRSTEPGSGGVGSAGGARHR